MNLLLLTLLLSAAPVAFVPTTNALPIDGDTVAASIVLTADIQLVGQHVRAVNYDAWESSRSRRSKPFSDFTDAQWKAEQARGVKARDELKALIDSGKLYVVLRGRDVYGRLLAEFWVYRVEEDELIDVAATMKARGHTRK